MNHQTFRIGEQNDLRHGKCLPVYEQYTAVLNNAWAYHAEPDRPATYVAQSSTFISSRALTAALRHVKARYPPPDPSTATVGTYICNRVSSQAIDLT